MRLQQFLPTQPSYAQSCELIDDRDDAFWHPLLEHLRQQHQLPDGVWHRIRDGGNLLFRLGTDLIFKLVPPNWGYQGTAEIESLRLLAGKLPLAMPAIRASGEINGWIYIIMTVVPGRSLSEFWPQLSVKEKRPLVSQLGRIIRELHQLPLRSGSSLQQDWQSYHQFLIEDCLPRHKLKGLPQALIDQIPALLAAADNYFDDGDTFFIHMDLNPWNLMVEERAGEYRLCGVLDFGDAVIGRSRLLELITPLLFMCQGNRSLMETLLDSYQLLDRTAEDLQHRCLVNSLIRPACDYNFVLEQVPETGPRETWQQIADQLFPV